MKTEIISDLGTEVYCDICNGDWTEREESGGFLLGSYAICPDCEDRIYLRLVKDNETKYIKEWCPEEMSYHDWVMRLRGGDNTIKFITYD